MTSAKDDGIPEDRLNEVLEVIEQRKEYHWGADGTKMIEPDPEQEVVCLRSNSSNCYHRNEDCGMIKDTNARILWKKYQQVEDRLERCRNCWKVPKDL